MKKIVSILVLAVIIPLFIATGCRTYEDEPILTNEYEILTAYMKSKSLDLPNVVDGTWVKPASGINVNTTDYSVPDYYIIDIRGEADFNLGHIKDAHNVLLANILTEAPKANGKPILVVCYTGQTAARATALLRLSGFMAHTLKWGMSGWHANFQAKWNTSAQQQTTTNWVNTGAPATVTQFNDPNISTGKTTGEEILKERINIALAMPSTTWGISNATVLTDPTKYFINNKWGQTHWDKFGHILGAYRIDVAEGLNIDGLKQFNPQAEALITYCYTGQTSSITTAWLNVVGFDNAKSLMFGATGIIWEDLKNGDDASKKSTWKGTASSSENNFGYYKTDGTYQPPL